MTQATNSYVKNISRKFSKSVSAIFSQRHFNAEVRTNPLVLAQPKLLRVQDFPKCTFINEKAFSEERDSYCTSRREDQIFL